MRFILCVLALLAVEECSAWSPSSSAFKTQRNELSKLRSTTEEETESSSSSRPDLPDYGKTSVQVDRIRLTKAKTKAKAWRRKDLFGNSLVDQTIKELENDADFQETAARYAELGAETVTREERAVRRRALDDLGTPSFGKFLGTKLDEAGFPKLKRREPTGMLTMKSNERANRQPLQVG
jgi:hypothetical protein